MPQDTCVTDLELSQPPVFNAGTADATKTRVDTQNLAPTTEEDVEILTGPKPGTICVEGNCTSTEGTTVEKVATRAYNHKQHEDMVDEGGQPTDDGMEYPEGDPLLVEVTPTAGFATPDNKAVWNFSFPTVQGAMGGHDLRRVYTAQCVVLWAKCQGSKEYHYIGHSPFGGVKANQTNCEAENK